MTGSDPTGPTRNFILDHLPHSEYNRIAPQLHYVRLGLGAILCEAGEERPHVYFPTDGLVSVMEILEEGTSSEIALIGNEGMVGITAVLGGKRQLNRVMVQSSGAAYRIPGEVFAREFRKGGVLMTIVLLYIQVLYTQVAKTAVCNRHHKLQQHLCRWLLMSLDRIDSDKLEMTQELIAGMLGVRREGITRAAGKMQKLGIIAYRRGRITVLDRRGLEEQCCECYEVLKGETNRLYSIIESVE